MKKMFEEALKQLMDFIWGYWEELKCVAESVWLWVTHMWSSLVKPKIMPSLRSGGQPNRRSGGQPNRHEAFHSSFHLKTL